MRVRCPHCGDIAIIHKSLQLSDQCREITCHCQNSLCGCTFVCHITPVRVLSPSAIPNPRITLPLSPHVQRRQLMLQLALPLKGTENAFSSTHTS